VLAAGALYNISANSASAPLVVEAGGVEALVELVKEGGQEGKTVAAETIMQLCADAATQAQAVAAGAIPPLVALLGVGGGGEGMGKTTSDSKTAVAGALRQLSLFCNAEVVSALSNAKSVAALVGLLRAETSAPEGKTAAASLLCSLASSPTSHESRLLIEAGAVEALVGWLSARDVDLGPEVDAETDAETRSALKLETAYALENLCVDERARQRVVRAGGVAALVEMVRAGGAEEAVAAASVLRTLSTNADAQAAVAEAGGVKPLVELLRTEDPGAKVMAAEVLHNYIMHAGNEAALIAAGGIFPLSDILLATHRVYSLWLISYWPHTGYIPFG
jgi:vacuolar protein 8